MRIALILVSIFYASLGFSQADEERLNDLRRKKAEIEERLERLKEARKGVETLQEMARPEQEFWDTYHEVLGRNYNGRTVYEMLESFFKESGKPEFLSLGYLSFIGKPNNGVFTFYRNKDQSNEVCTLDFKYEIAFFNCTESKTRVQIREECPWTLSRARPRCSYRVDLVKPWFWQ